MTNARVLRLPVRPPLAVASRPVDTEAAELRREIDGLRSSTVARSQIEQAKGILMARFRVDDGTAFQILRRWSMSHQVKIRDLASALIALTVSASTSDPRDEAARAVHHEIDAAAAH